MNGHFRLWLPIFAFASPLTNAHDLPPIEAPTWAAQRAQFPPIERLVTQTAATTKPSPLLFVVVRALKWNTGSTLRVCFFGASPELRDKIASIANQWSQYGNLTFDFGGKGGRDCAQRDTAAIRIGFSEKGNWSYIGRDSLDPALIGISSMNFESYDKSPPTEPGFSGVILHEFGHAIGFHHEHQNPTGGCDTEIDWDKIYPTFSALGWNKAMVDANMRSLMADSSAYMWSNVDRLSIMHYSLDPSIFKQGTGSKCYISPNNTISALDQQGMSLAYPKLEADASAEAILDRGLLQQAAGLNVWSKRDSQLIASKLKALSKDALRSAPTR